MQVPAQEGACAGVVHGVPGVPCSLPAQPGGAAVGAAVSAVCSRVVLARAGRRAAALPRRHVCGECQPLPVPPASLNQRELLRPRKKGDLHQDDLPVPLALQSQRVPAGNLLGRNLRAPGPMVPSNIAFPLWYCIRPDRQNEQEKISPNGL